MKAHRQKSEQPRFIVGQQTIDDGVNSEQDETGSWYAAPSEGKRQTAYDQSDNVVCDAVDGGRNEAEIEFPQARILPGACSGFDPCVRFFQAEDGIRDESVTGVQTCALP